jgi:hypothetical protein
VLSLVGDRAGLTIIGLELVDQEARRQRQLGAPMLGIDDAENEVVRLGGSHANCGRISITRFHGSTTQLAK